MSLSSFKNVINKICLSIIYLIHMYKKDMALHNQQWLIHHKTKLNQTKYQTLCQNKLTLVHYSDTSHGVMVNELC